MAVTVEGPGSFTGDSGWVDRDTVIQLEADSEGMGIFDRWTGDLKGGVSTQSVIQVTVDRALLFKAWFSLPFHWLNVNNPLGATVIGKAGGFSPAKSLAITDSIIACVSGDFDYNGRMDLVSINDSQILQAHLKRPGSDNQWQTEFIYEYGPHDLSLAVGDVNEDGVDDVVVGGANLEWWTRSQNASPTWRRNDIDENLPRMPVQAVALGDFDHDEDLDIAVASGSFPNGFALYWYERLDAVGQSWLRHDIATEPSEVPGSGSPQVSVLAAGDLDGDGDVDLALTAAKYFGSITTWENLDGLGRSWSNRLVGGLERGDYNAQSSLDLGDVDRDGDLDLLSTVPGADRVVLWRNKMDDGLGWSPQYLTSYVNFRGEIATSGIFLDSNQDGLLDVLVFFRDRFPTEKQDLYSFLNPGGDTDAWPTEYLLTDDSGSPTVLFPANMTIDGTIDLVGYGGGAGILWWPRVFELVDFLPGPSDSIRIEASPSLYAASLPGIIEGSTAQ